MQKKATSHLKSQAVYIDGKDRTDEIESYNFIGEKCTVTYKNNGKSYTYNKSKIQIVKSALQSDNAKNIFHYLKQIAETVGLKTEEGNNILAKSYQRLSFIPESSILSHYLTQKQPKRKDHPSPVEIFPFGFNLSQKGAVDTAFSNPLSVIEGPPGTGKTQTILNIIANAVMNGQSVAVVSSNNSATKNVFEKLEKNDISFIAALLGNSTNKKEFIDSQTPVPDLSGWKLSHEETQTLTESNSLLFTQLTEKLQLKNELALLNLELKNLETEHHHFSYSNAAFSDIRFKNNVSSDQLLSLWITLESYEESGKKLNWWRKLTFPFLFGVRDKNFYQLSYKELIRLTQLKYYLTKISELNSKQQQLESELHNFSFDSKMKEYTDVSMQLFRNRLSQRYNEKERPEYSEGDLRLKSEEFINDYPVIMSTTYSLRNSLDEKVMYDFVIIDESSQVDLATGVLALSCAKRAVIVGDLKQLPNVVDKDNTVKTDRIFLNYQLPEAFHYSNHSLLLSITEVFPDIPKTLLKEHYRCHPQIIDFCNRKFYNNQLIILSEIQTDRNPLIVYKTVAGNHARNLTNQRQIDVIIQDIIPKESLKSIDLGIVTPYRNQTSALQKAF